jgi:hypothetical protein
MELLPAILQWIANPIQPLGFAFVQSNLPLSLLQGIRDGFRNQTGLPGQLNSLLK